MSILTTAEEIINGQRAKDYGDARENHQRIANLWNAYVFPDRLFTPEDVAVMMILLKIARLMENGYHPDTVIDIAGYAGVLEKMQLPEGERYAAKPEHVEGFEKAQDQVPLAGTEWLSLWGEPKPWDQNTIRRAIGVPREWMRLDEVPEDVIVVDTGGHYWEFHPGFHDMWLWSGRGGRIDGSKFKTAPFTEVLSGPPPTEGTHE
ncbi:MAG: DUF6378 domain-containing protein [Isosphaeraceae bacterium]